MIIDKEGQKEYYVSTASNWRNVTDQIHKGHILIDEFKTWNPKPLPLSDSDYFFIKDKLPEWLRNNTRLSEETINQLSSLNYVSIKEGIKYVFTDYGHEEEDVYLLKLKYDDSIFRIYLCKRPLHYMGYDSTGDGLVRNKLIYPFENEDWNRNFYETKDEYLKMRKLEEDGYQKHFSN